METGVRTRFLHPLCTCAAALLLSGQAFALPPELEIKQFYHSAWTTKEGVPAADNLAQTRDGYLWLGSSSGLFRFDGVRFERIEAIRGQRLRSGYVFSLWAPPSGGLWLGYTFGGASFINDGKITNYGEQEGLPAGSVRNFAQDKSGTVWVATTRGLRRFDGSLWHDVSAELGLPKTYTSTLSFDRGGTMWVAVDNSIMFLPPGQRALVATDIQVGGNIRFLQGQDGILWLTDDNQGIRALYVPSNPASASKTWIRVAEPRLGPIKAKFIDREGTLWISSALGFSRLRDLASLLLPGVRGDAAADVFAPSDGLTSRGLQAALEDREGNVWIGTRGGLDQFRESRLIGVELPGGGDSIGFGVALAASEDGAVMVGTYSQRSVLKVTKGSAVEAVPGIGEISCAYRDPDGTIWFGGVEKIWHFAGQRWVEIELPVHNPVKQNYPGAQAIAKDGAGALWVSIPRAGVFRLANGKWSRYGEPAVSLTTDSEGRVWLGYPNSQVQVVDKEAVRHLSATDGLNVGTVLSMSAHTRNIWIGGERGVALFDGRRFHAVTRQGSTALPSTSGIVVTAEGDLWLSTSEGAMKVAAEEVRRVVNDPLHAVRYTLLDSLDGMPGRPPGVRPLPTMVEGTDGRLWFATTNGIAWTDPRHTVRNTLAPPVDVQAITADGVRYEPSTGPKLPIRTHDLQISYTALSLSIPQRVRFRYQLGAGQPWQDVGTRREAYFTDLAPGHYRFRVIASNNDGVWNETGATVDFEIPPAFVQTKWFLAMCAAAAAAALALFWSLWLRRIKARMSDRLEARLLERERIAQELHDTLLQGLLSASLQLALANSEISPDAPAKPLVERVFQLLRQMIDEGRNAVRGLRSGPSDSHELERAFAQIPGDLAADAKIRYQLIVEGTPRSLRPEIRDEVYRIGREALANAFRHSHASDIETVLDYSQDHFRIVVRDNGRGIDAEVLRSGRDGHWGLSGMRERSKKVGARLEVCSAAGAGTEVDLIIPGSTAFKDSVRNGSMGWLARFYSRSEDA